MELVTISKDGCTIVKHIWATINAISDPWDGSFNVPRSVAFGVGDRCQIETLDGRRATIVVSSAKSSVASQSEPREPHKPQIHVSFVLEGALLN